VHQQRLLQLPAAMALVVKPSAVIKALWFSIGTGAAYAAYLKLHKDLWTGAKQVS
jgi:hypothetical protein